MPRLRVGTSAVLRLPGADCWGLGCAPHSSRLAKQPLPGLPHAAQPPPPPRTSRNSITPSRAFLTSGVSVLIFMPGPAGMAHDATGLGLFSTCGGVRAPGRK